MIGRVKRWLGIEGVKLELQIPDDVSEDEMLEGKIVFYSMRPQTVKRIHVRMIEKYKRGRGKNKRTDEYELGAIDLEQDIDVPADTVIEVDFSLPFTLAKSGMETFADKNFIFRGVAGAASLLKGAKSEYRVIAEAEVKGTVLDPFDSKVIAVKS
jgi:hypothetical protein